MKNYILILLFLSAFYGCKPEGRIYEEHQHLSPDVEWLKEDKRTFNIQIDSINQIYHFGIAFRYAQGMPFKNIHLLVTEIKPDGTKNQAKHTLQVIDENNNYIGDPGGDIWDSEHIVNVKKKFTQKGLYSYTIEHDMTADPLVFAMEIGLFVDKVIDNP